MKLKSLVFSLRNISRQFKRNLSLSDISEMSFCISWDLIRGGREFAIFLLKSKMDFCFNPLRKKSSTTSNAASSNVFGLKDMISEPLKQTRKKFERFQFAHGNRFSDFSQKIIRWRHLLNPIKWINFNYMSEGLFN